MAMRQEMRKVFYVRQRDGDFGTWYQGWTVQGYKLLELSDERDPADGKVGRAFELQGRLEITD